MAPEIHLTKDDYDTSGWEEIIAQSGKSECFDYSAVLKAKAQEAEATKNARHQKVFTILAAITSLPLMLDSSEPPFGPLTIIDFINDEDIQILKDLIPTIADPDVL